MFFQESKQEVTELLPFVKIVEIQRCTHKSLSIEPHNALNREAKIKIPELVPLKEYSPQRHNSILSCLRVLLKLQKVLVEVPFNATSGLFGTVVANPSCFETVHSTLSISISLISSLIICL